MSRSETFVNRLLHNCISGFLAECGIAVAETPSVMARTLMERWGR